MSQYEKIQTVYKRDPETNYKTLIEGQYSLDIFETLADSSWVATEKVDGTNIRVYYNLDDFESVTFKGRTDRADIPSFLEKALEDLFPVEKLIDIFGETSHTVVLYGEGYGRKIQKGGGRYRNDVSFVLFDVKINGVYLTRERVEQLAEQLGVEVVPILGKGTLDELIDFVREGFKSRWGNFEAEGIVARPEVELQDRFGQRVITKIKCSDFPD